MENTSLKAFVRCKPGKLRKSKFSCESDKIIIGDKGFIFDSIFDDRVSQEEIYSRCVKNLVADCFSGFNATVFAYGQTGSGKTHSMVGDLLANQDRGIIPRALEQAFENIKRLQRENGDISSMLTRIVNVRLSFLEIYNDECRDLLHPEIPARDIAIREDRDGRIFFTGAREEVVTELQEAIHHLEYGLRSRTTGETCMNSASSRSHAIFTISFEIVTRTLETMESSLIQSKLHMVDLAGSERAKRTQATGARLKESVGINQGLLALGKVIRALTPTAYITPSVTLPSANSGSNRRSPIIAASHVPYRESKLTRFLQDSLGGNSNTVMLACVSQLDCDLPETLNTLQYACRARAIQNSVIANVKTATGLMSSEVDSEARAVEAALVDALRNQIGTMQSELDSLRQRKRSVGGAHAGTSRERASTASILLPSIDEVESSALVEETELLRQELEECREDLRRDEEIFAAKVRELRRARRTVAALEQENQRLKCVQSLTGTLPPAAHDHGLNLSLSTSLDKTDMNSREETDTDNTNLGPGESRQERQKRREVALEKVIADQQALIESLSRPQSERRAGYDSLRSSSQKASITGNLSVDSDSPPQALDDSEALDLQAELRRHKEEALTAFKKAERLDMQNRELRTRLQALNERTWTPRAPVEVNGATVDADSQSTPRPKTSMKHNPNSNQNRGRTGSQPEPALARSLSGIRDLLNTTGRSPRINQVVNLVDKSSGTPRCESWDWAGVIVRLEDLTHVKVCLKEASDLHSKLLELETERSSEQYEKNVSDIDQPEDSVDSDSQVEDEYAEVVKIEIKCTSAKLREKIEETQKLLKLKKSETFSDFETAGQKIEMLSGLLNRSLDTLAANLNNLHDNFGFDDNVLRRLLYHVVETNYVVRKSDETIEQLRSLMEEKIREVEQLQSHLAQERNETQRRLRRASDSRLGFSQGCLSQSQSRSQLHSLASSMQSIPFSAAATIGAVNRLENLSASRHMSDEMLSRVFSNASLVSIHTDKDGNEKEIIRRWHAEKERRETLERRNIEIVRELRRLRDAMQPSIIEIHPTN